jgi:hypothetical protein
MSALSPRQALSLSLCFAAQLGACGEQPPPPQIGSLTEAIIDGVPDQSHPAVGALLLDFDGDRAADFCSGTLIAPRSVLTAAHCVERALAGRTRFALTIIGPIYRVDRFELPPERNPDSPTVETDLALVVLEDPPDVAPVELAKALPSTGSSVTLVGVGDRELASDPQGNVTADSSSAGMRLAGSGTIHAVEKRIFTVLGREGNACAGDSGGAVFTYLDGREQQVGVISSASESFDLSAHVAVAAYADWLAQIGGVEQPLSGSGRTTAVDEPRIPSDEAGLLQGGCQFSASTPPLTLVVLALALICCAGHGRAVSAHAGPTDNGRCPRCRCDCAPGAWLDRAPRLPSPRARPIRCGLSGSQRFRR